MGEKPVLSAPELSLYELAKKQFAAAIRLMVDYNNIHNKAENKEEITAKDFLKAESQFEERIIDAATSNNTSLYNSGFINEDTIFKPSDETILTFYTWNKNNPEIIPAINNIEPLEDSFRRQLAYAPHKDLSLPENVKTPEELIPALLERNAGIAIGDIHSYSAALPFIYDNIASFKKAGVKTIYMELDDPTFLDLNAGSIQELQTMINSRSPETIQKSREATAEVYGTGGKRDNFEELLKLFLAAKENNIEIINIDKKGPARDFETSLSLKHRVSSTNYTWSENIIADRENKQPDDKYVVLAGLGHFTEIYTAKGLVDDKFGIPVIAFDNRPLNTESPILRGESLNSADFYLPAGGCYPDTKLEAKAADYNDIASASKPADRNIFSELASQYKEEFEGRVHLACEPANDSDSKQPPMVKVLRNSENALNK